MGWKHYYIEMYLEESFGAHPSDVSTLASILSNEHLIGIFFKSPDGTNTPPFFKMLDCTLDAFF